jgi:glycine betaine/proline transport system permease protein
MDPISSFWRALRFPSGDGAKSFFDWLTDNFDIILRGFSSGLNFLLDGLVDILLLLPPVLLVALIALLAYYLQRSKALAIGVALGLLFIINQGLWKQTVETLVLVVAASAASMAVGVPLGIWAAHKPNVYRIMLPILDLMQTLPTFVYSSRCLRCLALATRRVSS